MISAADYAYGLGRVLCSMRDFVKYIDKGGIDPSLSEADDYVLEVFKRLYKLARSKGETFVTGEAFYRNLRRHKGLLELANRTRRQVDLVFNHAIEQLIETGILIKHIDDRYGIGRKAVKYAPNVDAKYWTDRDERL